VKLIAKSLDYPCAERLKYNLVWMAEQLHRFGELTLNDTLRGKLETVSVSTIKRLVRYPEHRLDKIAFRTCRGEFLPFKGLIGIVFPSPQLSGSSNEKVDESPKYCRFLLTTTMNHHKIHFVVNLHLSTVR